MKKVTLFFKKFFQFFCGQAVFLNKTKKLRPENRTELLIKIYALCFLIAACAALRRAIGTRKGEQET